MEIFLCERVSAPFCGFTISFSVHHIDSGIKFDLKSLKIHDEEKKKNTHQNVFPHLVGNHSLHFRLELYGHVYHGNEYRSDDQIQSNQSTLGGNEKGSKREHEKFFETKVKA